MTAIQRTLNFSIEINVQKGLHHYMYRFKIDPFEVESSFLIGFDWIGT